MNFPGAGADGAATGKMERNFEKLTSEHRRKSNLVPKERHGY